MKELVTAKRTSLEPELQAGQNRLQELQAEIQRTAATVQQIAGAIQACKDLEREIDGLPAPDRQLELAEATEAAPAP